MYVSCFSHALCFFAVNIQLNWCTAFYHKEEEERPAREPKESKKAAAVSTETAPELKSTLGDLDALVELKKKMEEGK